MDDFYHRLVHNIFFALYSKHLFDDPKDREENIVARLF